MVVPKDAGNSVGEIFVWFIQHAVPESYHRLAEQQRMDIEPHSFRTIDSLQAYLNLDAAGLAGTELFCPICQRFHRVPIQQILVGNDLSLDLSSIVKDAVGAIPEKILVIYDRAIEDLVSDRVLHRWRGLGLPIESLPIGQEGKLLEATVELGDNAVKQVKEDTELIVGVGSGVIADLTKWIADRVGKPFLLYATAPSMNAHTSITASMTENGVKQTKYLNPAKAVLFELPILADAPLDMRQAGVGDLVARAICNADWMLSQHLRGTYFCPVPYQLTARYEGRYLQAATGIRTGDSKALEALSEAILVSGISMTMLAGETSPSSGAEHVLSHFWDLQVELEGAAKNLHGIQVAIGTVLAFTLYQYMGALDPTKIDPQRLIRERMGLAEIEAENERYYCEKAPLFNQAVRAKWISQSEFEAYLKNILDGWDNLWDTIQPYIGEVSEISSALRAVGIGLSLNTIRRTREQVKAALLHGSRYRPRYTILDLAWELGVFPDAVDEVLELSGLL